MTDPAALSLADGLGKLIDWLAEESYDQEIYDFLQAENARLRAQNKESSDAWTRRTAKLESDFTKLKNDIQRGNELIDAHRHAGSDESFSPGNGWPDGDADSRHCSWDTHCAVTAAVLQMDALRERLAATEAERDELAELLELARCGSYPRLNEASDG